MKKLDTPVMDYPGGNEISALVADYAAQHPDKVALIQDGYAMTFTELNRHISQVAHGLRKLGFNEGIALGGDG